MHEVVNHSIMITSFVFIMMLLVEYINVYTKGYLQNSLSNNRIAQYFLSAFLGAIPGCLGTYTAVSLYSHNIIRFGALISSMIATSGDAAFVMFSMFPKKAFHISIILFFIGIITGILVDKILSKKALIPDDSKFSLHEDEACINCSKKLIISQLKNITFSRTLLIIMLTLVLLLLFFPQDHHSWGWEKTTLLVGTFFSLLVVLTVSDHFLEKHLWEHVLKKHLPRIFMWTFSVLVLIHFCEKFINIEKWVVNNELIVLLAAVLIGLIPDSGPHLVFVTLYAGGTIPLSILIANSIVQDGHGAIPLLAFSRKSFIYVKLINLCVGFLVGIIGLYCF